VNTFHIRRISPLAKRDRNHRRQSKTTSVFVHPFSWCDKASSPCRVHLSSTSASR
jgi:hypothetical protein